MKITLNIEAVGTEELLTALRELSGVCDSALVGDVHFATSAKYDQPEETETVTIDDPRDVYGSGNGPVDAVRPDPVAPVETADTLPEHDANGELWSEDHHTNPPKLNKDGTWRKRRGANAAPQGVVTPAPATPATSAPTPSVPVATELTIQQFMEQIGTAVANGDAKIDYIQSITREFELQTLADLANDPEKLAVVVEKTRADGVLK